jgi:hypothetical protein
MKVGPTAVLKADLKVESSVVWTVGRKDVLKVDMKVAKMADQLVE